MRKIECDCCHEQIDENDRELKGKWHVAEIDGCAKYDICDRCYLRILGAHFPGEYEAVREARRMMGLE